MFEVEHVADDADVFWLYLVLGIMAVITIILVICFDRKGNLRKWLVNRLKARQ